MSKMPFNNLKMNKSKRVVVEIGNDWFKIIESTDDRIMKVYCKKLVEIKGDVSQEIDKTFRSLNLSRQGVTLCLPRYLVTTRILELPSIDPKEIRGMVNLQVGKQIPYAKEEIVFDHKIVSIKQEGYSRVMLVIVRRNIINERVDVLQQANIEVSFVSISSEGVQNWFSLAHNTEELKEDEALAVIDVDSNYSDFNVICGGKLVFTRNILIGANHFSSDEQKWKDKFLSEIAHVQELYLNEERNIRIVKIFLTGAGQAIMGLDKILGEHLKNSVAIISPIENIHIRGDIDVLQYEHFKFVSICPLIGIAMRYENLEINLTPSELRIQHLMDEKRRHMTLAGILIVAIVMLTSSLLGVHIYHKNTYLAQLKQRVGAIDKEAHAVEKMRLYIDLVEKRLDAKRRTLNVLHEIYQLTPKEIYFTNINIEETKRAVLQGRAFAMSNVFKFVTTLEKSSFFENVKTTYTTTKKEKGLEYAKFEIICMFEGGNSGFLQ